MKKFFSFVATLFISGVVMADLQKNESGYYVINNDEDMMEFADLVNGSGDYSGKAERNANAILTADIDLDGWAWTPIGKENAQYIGTFDGQGHRILGLTDTPAGDDYVGVFGAVGGGVVIKNLIIDASCAIEGNKFVGGIAGGSTGKGKVRIENCGNEATISATNENAAGIIGVNMGSAADFEIYNCYNTGTVTCDHDAGAITGWAGDRWEVYNCWNTGEINGREEGRPLFRRNNDLTTYGGNWDIYGKQIEASHITNDMLAGMASGAFCYQVLNGTMTENVAWYQKLGEDAHPYPFADRGIVYAVGDLNCDGTSKGGDTSYSNENNSNRDEHQFAHGACTVCDEFDTTYEGVTDEEGNYLLDSEAELYWFARYVNTVDPTANAKVTADINYTKQVMIGVDTDKTRYAGTFDGQEHTITIALKTDERLTGLFRAIGGATIENLHVAGTIEASVQCAGGIGAASHGSTKISNCISSVDITSTVEGDGTFGGILAFAWDDAVIENCAFTGSINAPAADGSGGIMGYSNGGNNVKVLNCYVSGVLTMKEGTDNIWIARNNPYIENCWINEENSIYKSNSFTEMFDPETLTTGEFCYKNLNATQTQNVCWYQTLGTDAYPVPFYSHGTVYVAGAQTCDGTPKGETTGYSNDPSGDRDEHAFDGAYCSVCHAVNPDYLPADENGNFAIATTDQLDWFISYTKTQATKTANAYLTADVTYENAENAFGVERCEYAGTFDGQGHTVTLNLSKEGSRVALFDRVKDATIKNLVVDGELTSDGMGGDEGQFIAGLVVEASGKTTISRILVKASITSDYDGDGTHGGIVAIGHDNLTLENCAFVGEFDASLTYGCGGLVGFAYNPEKTHIKNCYVYSVLGFSAGEVFCRADEMEKLKVENTWLNGDNDWLDMNIRYIDYIYEDDMLESGELCYLLNDGGNNWYQTLGTDAYPVPFATSKKVYAQGKLTCDGEPDGNFVYTNEESAPERPKHQYDEETGLCSVCERAYLITTAKQFVEAAQAIQDFTCVDGDIELAANIDLEGEEFSGFGSEILPFEGTFDGHGHIVSNWTYTDAETNHMGLVAYASGKAVVRNVTVVDTDINVKGYAAGIVGAFRGETLAIQNCGSEANVTVSEANAAGILGCNFGGQVTIENCYNTGAIVGERESASICGWLGGNAVVMNVYNIGAVQGADYYNAETGQADYFARMDKGNAAKYINCYEFNPDYNITGFSADELADGTLCSLLNNGEEGPFVQPEGVDHPVLGAEYTPNGIKNVGVIASGVAGTYSITGMRINAMQKGINIVRLSDGTVRKVLVK